ncbi:lipopolysaccharide biosynthesis protein [Liquorilactobacillus hordei]|nr:oligosaccharide flippase family protein [Liquorilactobacillus hordei]QYH52207.1 oligosaccharide flippase family protein [Liquorilactobacillus hordei DSM 19519]
MKFDFLKVGEKKLALSMILSTLCKPISMLLSFVYVPILLSYLGVTNYGIWMTIMTIINWINYFDIGIGNGLRNLLTSFIVQNKFKEAKIAVSTAYVALSLISFLFLIIGSVAIILIDTKNVFNSVEPLKLVLFISFFFICINFIFSLSKTELYSLHQAEKTSYILILTQCINLVGIFSLSLFGNGSILAISILTGFSTAISYIIFSMEIWRKKKYLAPNFHLYQAKMLKAICNLGVEFFIIQIAVLVLYSSDNFIIIKLFGPDAVTPYTTTYNAFGIVNGLFGAMIAPLWSRFTVAFVRKDFIWMKKTLNKLNLSLIPIILVLLCGVLFFKPLSVIWLHKTLFFDKGLIPMMGIYYFLMIWGSIYSTFLNGIGKIKLQLYLAVFGALINIPLSIFFGKYCEMRTTGVLLATIICMVISNVPLTIQAINYLRKNSSN